MPLKISNQLSETIVFDVQDVGACEVSRSVIVIVEVLAPSAAKLPIFFFRGKTENYIFFQTSAYEQRTVLIAKNP